MSAQLFWGTVVLGLCSSIHILVLIYWVGTLWKINDRLRHIGRGARLFLLIGVTFAVIIFSHTVQVWLWAGTLIIRDATHNWSDAVYFSLVTYTTVGYGDVTLATEHRIFGAMASVTGLFNFGLSTAFQVSLLAKLFPEHLR